MGFKCAPQLLGLTRNDPPKGQKHRANGGAILGEFGEFEEDSTNRNTHSDTYNSELSYLNRYLEGGRNGYAVWDEMVDRANNFRVKVKGKSHGKEIKCERKLPENAVIGFAMIINPPEEVCKDWTDDEYLRFYSDSFDAMHKICPEIFRLENIRMMVEHFDEGLPPHSENDRHMHWGGDCIDENGKYCGNKIDSKLLTRINKEYPKLMRDRGWDVDDLEVTDWKKYNKKMVGRDDEGHILKDENGKKVLVDNPDYDPEYRKAQYVKRKSAGRSVNKYNEDKAVENVKGVYQEAESVLSQARNLNNEVEEKREVNDKRSEDLEAWSYSVEERDSEVAGKENRVQKVLQIEARIRETVSQITGKQYDEDIDLETVFSDFNQKVQEVQVGEQKLVKESLRIKNEADKVVGLMNDLRDIASKLEQYEVMKDIGEIQFEAHKIRTYTGNIAKVMQKGEFVLNSEKYQKQSENSDYGLQ